MTVGETSRWASGWELGRLWANVINGTLTLSLSQEAICLRLFSFSLLGKAK